MKGILAVDRPSKYLSVVKVHWLDVKLNTMSTKVQNKENKN